MTPMTSPDGPARADDEIGPGLLSRASAVVYWFVVVEALVVLTTVPALVWVPFLEPHWSNVPLMVALAIPVGPALSASFFAWRRFGEDRDLKPARHFWRGYRLNWADALRLWVPALVVLVLLGFNLANLTSTDAPVAFGVVGALVAVVAVVWTAHALLVTSLFSFRARDVSRIAAFFLVAKPLVSLGVLSIAVLALAVTWWAGDWLPVALASVFTYLLWRNGAPVVAEVHRRFVVGAPDAPEAKPWQGLDGIDLDDAADSADRADRPEGGR